MSSGEEKIQKYFNRKQQEAMAVAAKDEYIVASRAFGKSEGIDAPRLIRNVFAMPRSAGAILSPTYTKLLSNTLPAMFHALDRMGYRRNIHYFLGRRAPKNLGFESPYINPFSYDHVIHWFNGSIQHLLSFDRPMSANSMNLDYILAPEAKFLNYDKVKSEVLPANRGNINYFGDCPWHHGQVYTTDMPTSKAGMWILDKQEEMDPDMIDLIKNLYVNYKRLKDKEDSLSSGSKSNLRRFKRELDYWRRKATFYAEYNVIDNIEILGTDFIKQMKRDLPPLIFQTAILNKRLRKIPGGFYANLEEKIHYYETKDNSYLDNLRSSSGDIDLKRAGRHNCLKDGDIDTKTPLHISFDYNANINWVVTGQPLGNELRTLNAQYTKYNEKLRVLCEKWADYYQPFQIKDVIYYYDSTALISSYADEETETFRDIVVRTLSKRGWNVRAVYMGQQMRHSLKHQYIDDALTGKKYLFPTFNKYNCEYLTLAMETTGIKIGRNGFEKDKSGEKKEETPEDMLESRTDSTDAWDSLFIGCNFFPYKKSSFSSSAQFPN